MSKILNKIGKAVESVNPSTLTGISVFTAWMTAILMIPATVKAVKKKEKEKPEGVWNTIKCVAPCYIPPMVSLGVSTATGIASNNKHLRQNAAMAVAASVAEKSLVDYKDIVSNTVDKETMKEIDKKEFKQIVRQNPPHIEQDLPKVTNEITEFGAPKCICYESYTKKYFWFAPADLERLEYEITNDLINDGQYTMVDLMWSFGLDPINDNNLGFLAKDYMTGDGVKFKFRTSPETAPDGRPVLVINYWVNPHAIDPESY